MIQHKAYKFRIYPNKEQKILLEKTFGCVRFVYNHYLAVRREVYETKKNELVRTKSEMMLADMYYELGIPYRYEAQLLLKNGKKKYPDFTLLKTKITNLLQTKTFSIEF